MKKIYIIGGGYQEYVNWILPLGFQLVKNQEEAEVVLLSGGEDWDSSWYSNEKPHLQVYSNIHRDNREMAEIKIAIQNKQKIVGVCRGSQILPVLAGKEGRIVQHQNNPGFIHNVTTYDGKVIPVSSTHHQCAFPYLLPKSEYKLLAWSENLLKYRYYNSEELIGNSYPETEVVYYPNVGGGALGYQPHFEMIYDKSYKESISWAQETFMKFISSEL